MFPSTQVIMTSLFETAYEPPTWEDQQLNCTEISPEIAYFILLSVIFSIYNSREAVFFF